MPRDYGKANKFQFDDPTKWFTVPSVPLLDEHTLTNDDGTVVASVDRAVLEEIAYNRNRDVYERASPATLILGHTSDDPRAPEKPAKGFVVNYQVKPFDRNKETGQIIYAIHGDYKLRPKNAHLIEEYPNRSVELWWNKRDINPVAMLGGTTPERDLGAVLRHGRLTHIAMLANPSSSKYSSQVRSDPTLVPDGDVIKFHKRGNFTIENYSIADLTRYRFSKGGKVEKVMHEFKEGTLHSGSKSGPQVTSRKQAVAIALNEQRKQPHKKSEATMNNGKKPIRCEDDDDDRMRYGDGEFEGDTHDPGDEGVPGEFDGDDMHGSTDAGANGLDGQDDNDPVIQKVMQSKWAKGIDDKLSMILEALQGGPEGGGMGGAGGMDGQSPAGVGGEEMPPPGAGADPSGMGMEGAPAPGDDMNQNGVPDEEESRRGMGQRPVQMNAGPSSTSTGFPGHGNTYIPGMNGKKSKMSRSTNGSQQPNKGSTSMNGSATRQRSQGRDPRDVQILRLRRQNAEMQAREIIRDLEQEGVLFGRDPQSSEKIKFSRIEELTLAILHDEDTKDQGTPDSYVADKIDEMRLCYARRQTDDRGRQRLPQSSGVARYARNPTQEASAAAQAQQEADFEPTSDEQVVEMADLQAGTAPGLRGQKMPYPEVVKYMRKKYLGR